MKTKALCLIIAIMALTVAAVAAGGTGHLTLRETAQLNGTSLPAGDYKLTWTGEGASVNVTVLKNNKQVATTTAKITEQTTPAPYDSVFYKTDANNKKSIAEIRFEGKKSAIVFE